jgi:hypothetical protein
MTGPVVDGNVESPSERIARAQSQYSEVHTRLANIEEFLIAHEPNLAQLPQAVANIEQALQKMIAIEELLAKLFAGFEQFSQNPMLKALLPQMPQPKKK